MVPLQAYPTVAWSQLKYNGDLDAVRKNWDGLKLFAKFWMNQVATKNATQYPGGFGDWVAPGKKSNGALTGMFATMHDLGLIAEMAQAIGDTDTAAAATASRSKAGAEFHRAWYQEDKQCYSSCLQTENAFALWVGADVVPSELVAGVVNQTATDVLVTHSGHTTSGILGIKAIYEALSRLGRADVPVLMSAVTTYPSYGYMIHNQYEPATTLW